MDNLFLMEKFCNVDKDDKDENMNIHNTRGYDSELDTVLCVLFSFLNNFIQDNFSDIKTLIDAKCCPDLVTKNLEHSFSVILVRKIQKKLKR